MNLNKELRLECFSWNLTLEFVEECVLFSMCTWSVLRMEWVDGTTWHELPRAVNFSQQDRKVDLVYIVRGRNSKQTLARVPWLCHLMIHIMLSGTNLGLLSTTHSHKSSMKTTQLLPNWACLWLLSRLFKVLSSALDRASNIWTSVGNFRQLTNPSVFLSFFLFCLLCL